MEPTTGTKRRSEEDDQTKSMKKNRTLVTVDPNLTVQSLFTHQLGPLRNILGYLDPGIDWPICRKVCTSWHKCILSAEKELKEDDVELWTGDVIPIYPESLSSYAEAIQADRELVRRTTKEERLNYIEGMKRAYRREEGWDSDEEDSDTDLSTTEDDLDAYQKWVRLDVGPNEKGECNIEGGIARKETSVAKAKIHFLCRNAHLLVLDRLEKELESVSRTRDELTAIYPHIRQSIFQPTVEIESPPFFFAGTYWRVCVGVLRKYWRLREGVNVAPRFGVRLERLSPKEGSEIICSRRDIDCPAVDDDLSAFVRYKASFSTGSKEVCKDDFVHDDPPSYAQINRGFQYRNGDHSEQIPLYVAQFALGPPPSSTPDLRITIELEFMGYNWFQDSLR